MKKVLVLFIEVAKWIKSEYKNTIPQMFTGEKKKLVISTFIIYFWSHVTSIISNYYLTQNPIQDMTA